MELLFKLRSILGTNIGREYWLWRQTSGVLIVWNHFVQRTLHESFFIAMWLGLESYVHYLTNKFINLVNPILSSRFSSTHTSKEFSLLLWKSLIDKTYHGIPSVDLCSLKAKKIWAYTTGSACQLFSISWKSHQLI